MKMNIKQKLRYAAALALGTVFMAAGSFHAWASQAGANPAAAQHLGAGRPGNPVPSGREWTDSVQCLD